MNENAEITQAIVFAIDKVLADRLAMFRADDPDYEERVAWVRAQIQRDKDNHDMKMKIIGSALAWVLPLSIAFVAVSIWHEVVAAIRSQ
jgi:hypothetical protein